ncbi:MAG: tetratricopeptide repeat protein, partial [bacterium]
LRDIIENNPHSNYRLQAYVHLGNLYRQTREWHAAEHVYRDIIRYYPNTSWAWICMTYLAETHAHTGDIHGALSMYRRLLNDPRVPDTMRAQAEMRMGDLYIEDQQWLEALQTYRDCLRDFSQVPGVQGTCQVKIKIATEGRRYNRVPYRTVDVGIHVVDQGPADEDFLLKQEKLPNQ